MVCNKPARYKYTWPGKDENVICESCGLKLQAVASAVGMHLQMRQLDEINLTCPQIVKEEIKIERG